ncbi:Hypothetical predicted protein [Lecanosticta acicola]|uniref:AB hydrolase-1 domain-containing protein n=1 Tax=Lecanosticta acicola TaxID=111012 RepID=A0AAI8W0R9_9PEZI|nr:Hypothetical predicted protein [Lecanosticta acicola]
MAEQHVFLDGINYYTLLEQPPPGIQRKNETILLVHALMSNLHMWDHTVQTLLREGYTTLRFDHVGHNKTPPPRETEQNFSLHLDDITRHMHSLVLQTTGRQDLKAVVGCSIGGVLALRYAMLYPRNVAKVISIAAPGIVCLEAAKPLWTQRIAQFRQDLRTGEATLAEATVNRWFPHHLPSDDAVRAEALQQVQTCSLEGYGLLADAIRNYDYADEVRGILGQEVGVLIVAGSEDSSVSPGLLKDLAGRISRARFVRMEGAGHLPPMQRAGEFEGVVLMPFLAG